MITETKSPFILLVSLISIVKRTTLSLSLVAVCVPLLTGCGARPYNRVPFIWNSDHRLAPNERTLTVTSSPESTVASIREWTDNNGGEVLDSAKGSSFSIKLTPDSESKFSEAQKIALKHWVAIDENKFLKWVSDEMATLRTLTEDQTLQTESEDQSYRLTVRVGNRSGTTTYQEQTGSYTMHQQPFNVYKSTNAGIKTTTLRPPPVTIPTYETKTLEKDFYSLIKFYVSRDHGQTIVYATGVPVEGSTGNEADYNRSVSYAWWPQISGKQEATFIKDAFQFLSGE